MRNAWENNGKFGCSITPRKSNLATTKQFLEVFGLRDIEELPSPDEFEELLEG